jgi:integrase
MKTLTLQEAQRFLIAAAKDKYGLVFRVALWTGMRPEEYLGLQWKDVDFNEGTITILRAMLFNRKGGGWYFKEPKTAQSRRTIPIPAHLVGQLKRHRTKQLKERLKAGDKYQNYDLVFAKSSGSPILIRNLDRRRFKPLLEKAELPDIRLYDLRHSCANASFRSRRECKGGKREAGAFQHGFHSGHLCSCIAVDAEGCNKQVGRYTGETLINSVFTGLYVRRVFG